MFLRTTFIIPYIVFLPSSIDKKCIHLFYIEYPMIQRFRNFKIHFLSNYKFQDIFINKFGIYKKKLTNYLTYISSSDIINVRKSEYLLKLLINCKYCFDFQLSKVLSHLLLTFIGAIVLSTMFESPILGLEKVFLRPALKKFDKSDTSSRNSSEETIATNA